jgi:hypothetical protein
MIKATILRAIFAAILILAVTALAQAAPRCDNKTLKGTYGEIGWGDVVVPIDPSLVGPFTRAGQTIADGNGTIVSHTVASFNGIIFQVPEYSGQYAVHPDCTLEIHLTIPIPTSQGAIPVPIDFVGVISDQGRSVANMITSIAGGQPGVTVRILFRKQEKDHCSDHDMSGTYGLDMWGTNATQAPVGSISRNGVLQFDGNGAFTATTDVSYAGGIVHEVFSGGYSVDSRCTLTLQYTHNGTTYKWFGGLADSSATSSLMVVNPPGAAVIGKLTQQ